MRSAPFAEAAAGPGIAAGGLHGAGGEMEVRAPGGEEPGTGGTVDAKVGTQDFEEARGEHGVTVFAALAVIDADEHALTIDAGELEGDGFGDEAGSVAGEEDGGVFAAGDVVEELLDLVGGEDDGESRRGRGKSSFFQGISSVTRKRNWAAETKQLMDCGESLRSSVR